VPNLQVQAVRLLEELGGLGRVAVGGGTGKCVEGDGLGLEVVVLACLLQHGTELLDGRLGVTLDRQGGEEAAGEQSAVAAARCPVPPVVLLEQGPRRRVIARTAEPAGQVDPSGGRDAEVAAGGCSLDGPGQGVEGLVGSAGPLLDPAESRQVEGRLADEPKPFRQRRGAGQGRGGIAEAVLASGAVVGKRGAVRACSGLRACPSE